ncbi:MAG: hypothetical protein DCC75_06945 [Proteobacteria bacterium]|nr:MAG: hypothetical protein DCC75_06945 [Pseudomonadota bacterium]
MEPLSQKPSSENATPNYLSYFDREGFPEGSLTYLANWQRQFDINWSKLTHYDQEKYILAEAVMEERARLQGSQMILPYASKDGFFIANFCGPFFSEEQCFAQLCDNFGLAESAIFDPVRYINLPGVVAILGERTNRVKLRNEWEVKILTVCQSLPLALQESVRIIKQAGPSPSTSAMEGALHSGLIARHLSRNQFGIENLQNKMGRPAMTSARPAELPLADDREGQIELPRVIHHSTGKYALSYLTCSKQETAVASYFGILKGLNSLPERYDLAEKSVELPPGFVRRRIMTVRTSSCELSAIEMELPENSLAHLTKIFPLRKEQH